MAKKEELLRELEEFKKCPKPEIVLKDLERWMFERLSVERVKTGKGKGKKKGKGSTITYYHEALLKTQNRGHFTIHKSRSKKESIRTPNFRNYMYRPLKEIIEFVGE